MHNLLIVDDKNEICESGIGNLVHGESLAAMTPADDVSREDVIKILQESV